MAYYEVFNLNRTQVETISANSEAEAIKKAKLKGIIAPSVRRLETPSERISREYEEHLKAWDAMCSRRK